MTQWIGLLIDTALIGVVGAGVVQATRLIRQLQDLRASRAEMQKFVREFNGSVIRAEAGVKSLRMAARESGDDLESLLEKSHKVRDELTILVESADGIAERLSSTAANVVRSDTPAAPKAKGSDHKAAPRPFDDDAPPPTAPRKVDLSATSRAEQELIQALKKLG